MSSSPIPACLAVTSWHRVIISDSLPILIICPFCPTLISSKLSAYYAPYVLWCWCHFCVSSHRNVTCVISCQQKKKNCHFVPLSIVNSSPIQHVSVVICHVRQSVLSLCPVVSVSLLSFLSISFPQSLQSFSICAGFYPLSVSCIYSILPIYLPVLLPVCPLAESF